MEIFVGIILVLSLVGLAGLLVLRKRQRRRPEPWATQLDVDPKPNVVAALLQKLTGLFSRGNRDQQPLEQGPSPSLEDLGSLPEAGPSTAVLDDDPTAPPADGQEAIPLANRQASAAAGEDEEAPSLTDILDLGALSAGIGSNEDDNPDDRAVAAETTVGSSQASASPIGAGSGLEGLGDLREMFKTERAADPRFEALVGRVQPVDAESIIGEIQSLTDLVKASVEEYPEAFTGLDGDSDDEEQENPFGLIAAGAEGEPES